MNEIPTAKLGNTGIDVGRVGLGTVKFGRTQCLRYPRPFSLPTDQEIIALLSLARERGVNVLDTAPAYGSSEERIGKLLPGRREDWVIVTKCGEEFSDGRSSFDFTPSHLRESLLRSLMRLKTSYVDVLLVHSNGDDDRLIQNYDIFETLAGFKKEGLVRAIGFSAKTVHGAREAMKNFDVLMLSLNPLWKNMIDVIRDARTNGIGILTKHTLNSGRLDELHVPEPLEDCLNFAIRECDVPCALIGTSELSHLKEVISVASRPTKAQASVRRDSRIGL